MAADVCGALKLSNVTKAMLALDEEDVTLSTIQGSHRLTNIINESGLYSLIMTSRKPEAKRFKKWATSEVLPTIRKTGHYDATAVKSDQGMNTIQTPGVLPVSN